MSSLLGIVLGKSTATEQGSRVRHREMSQHEVSAAPAEALELGLLWIQEIDQGKWTGSLYELFVTSFHSQPIIRYILHPERGRVCDFQEVAALSWSEGPGERERGITEVVSQQQPALLVAENECLGHKEKI